jgi:hypothetical protein
MIVELLGLLYCCLQSYQQSQQFNNTTIPTIQPQSPNPLITNSPTFFPQAMPASQSILKCKAA